MSQQWTFAAIYGGRRFFSRVIQIGIRDDSIIAMQVTRLLNQLARAAEPLDMRIMQIQEEVGETGPERDRLVDEALRQTIEFEPVVKIDGKRLEAAMERSLAYKLSKNPEFKLEIGDEDDGDVMLGGMPFLT